MSIHIPRAVVDLSAIPFRQRFDEAFRLKDRVPATYFCLWLALPPLR